MPADLQSIPFDPANPRAALAALPHAAAVFALYGAEAKDEPYIGRTPNLRARLERLLQPSAKHPRRLQLASRVRRIAYRLTGSDFESLLIQLDLLQREYGTKCLERMHLRAPAFIRYLGSNAYPRITVTHRVNYRPGQREAAWFYGPFASRAAAERFADEALKLFLLRRCTDDLAPDPSHPGCVYSEMKMCLAPCYKGCTEERYAQEATAVEHFLATRGESRLVPLRTLRDRASENLEFEAAQALHAQAQRVEAVRALAPELVRPLNQLRAVILQASAQPGEVAVFLYENGLLRGPAAFLTHGMRIQNEQAGSTSLFPQPMLIEPVPEGQGSGIRDQGSEISQSRSEQDVPGHHVGRANNNLSAEGASAPAAPPAPPQETVTSAPKLPRNLLETRLESLLAALAEPRQPANPTLRQGHLALLKRWYYRPESRRAGEIFFPDQEDHWPFRPILRGIGRVASKSLQTPPAP